CDSLLMETQSGLVSMVERCLRFFLPKAYHFLSFAGQLLALLLTKLYKNSVKSIRLRDVSGNAAVQLLLVIALSGCGRNDVQVYRVEKDQGPSQAAVQAQTPSMPPGHPEVSAGGAPKLNYKVPPDWQEAPPGQM